MTGYILIDRDSRIALADFLADKERPKTIPTEVWHELLTESRAKLSFEDLGELVDVVSYEVIDILRVSEKTAVIRALGLRRARLMLEERGQL